VRKKAMSKENKGTESIVRGYIDIPLSLGDKDAFCSEGYKNSVLNSITSALKKNLGKRTDMKECIYSGREIAGFVTVDGSFELFFADFSYRAGAFNEEEEAKKAVTDAVNRVIDKMNGIIEKENVTVVKGVPVIDTSGRTPCVPLECVKQIMEGKMELKEECVKAYHIEPSSIDEITFLSPEEDGYKELSIAIDNMAKNKMNKGIDLS
jgi:hypothetical protein